MYFHPCLKFQGIQYNILSKNRLGGKLFWYGLKSQSLQNTLHKIMYFSAIFATTIKKVFHFYNAVFSCTNTVKYKTLLLTSTI